MENNSQRDCDVIVSDSGQGKPNCFTLSGTPPTTTGKLSAAARYPASVREPG